MRKTELSSTKTVAFYDKSEAQQYVQEQMNEDTTVGIDVNIEKTEMKDTRTAAKLTVYTVTVFSDLAQAR